MICLKKSSKEIVWHEIEKIKTIYDDVESTKKFLCNETLDIVLAIYAKRGDDISVIDDDCDK